MSDAPVSVRKPLTVRELLAYIAAMEVRLGRSLADLPVHVMDLDPDTGPNENLTTDVEVDCFEEGEGNVLSIFRWQTRNS